MAIIKPFYGYRYNPAAIEKPGEVMAPPYDSLSDAQTDSCYDLNPYNAARLVSTRTYETDTDTDNCYTRARAFLEDWINENILIKEDKKSFYVYEQTITVNREKYYNRGVIGLLKLTDYEDGIVVPCENPSTDSKLDRLNMVKTTQANNSLVSCMYTDRNRPLSSLLAKISESVPETEFITPNDGITHKLWVIKDDETISFIAKAFEDKKLFIVDGHNRYEACLEYKNECMKKSGYTGDESFNYIMALISDSKEDGRVQMPIHRLITKEKKFNEDYIIAGLQDNFTIEKIIVDKIDDDFSNTLRKQITTQRKETIFAIYTGKDYFYRFRFKDNGYIKSLLPSASDIYSNLDISILNKLVLEEQLNMDPDGDNRIEYTRSLRDGINAVDSGEYSCLFVLNPVRTWQVEGLINFGEKLPKRSVSIFPKPATGIVIHKFNDNI